MATTVTGTNPKSAARGEQSVVAEEVFGRRRGGDGSSRGGPNGKGSNGGGRRRDGGDGGSTAEDRYRIGMWVALASILMMFTALTSAYIVRSGGASDWRPISVPPFLWASTGLLVISSFVVERARRLARQGALEGARTMLAVTLLLGLGFVVTQMLAWRHLVAQGVYLKSNPHSSFFYVLTGLHGLHVVGGIAGLTYLLLRTSRLASSGREVKARRLNVVEPVTLYWHFMDGLWIYLFLLLFLWR
jgi:cytochrome c oxidase subunit 3